MQFTDYNFNTRTMLTSQSQYLHPDYLQPLPTTLDAKKSPLALLAQTCSSIGKDTSSPSSNKSIIPPLEKKDSKSVSPHSKPGSADGRKSHSSHSSTADRREGSPVESKPSFRTPAPKEIPPLVPIPSPGSNKGGSTEPTATSDRELSPRGSSAGPTSRHTPNSALQSSSKISLNCGNLSLEVNHHEAASAAGLYKGAITNSGSMPIKSEGLVAPTLLPPSLPGCPLPVFGHPMDAASNHHIYSSSIAAHNSLASAAHKHAALGGHMHGAGGMSPYVAYARVRTTTGATTLVPICRDPYCTNCQVTLQNAQLSSVSGGCGAGCTQCNHEKSFSVPTSLHSSLGSPLGGLPILPMSHGGVSMPGASSLLSSPLYSHAFGPLQAAHHGLPYVCNWISGSEYCGKRFSQSDELLQHLRSHTSSSESAAAAAAASLSPYAGLINPPSFGCHSHYTTGSLSPNSLRQAYPRSLSPSSLLAAARYHPYKSALSSLSAPPSVGLSVPGLPAGLGAYYPYSLYGQRLGVAP